jgi:hypothetical protein
MMSKEQFKIIKIQSKTHQRLLHRLQKCPQQNLNMKQVVELVQDFLKFNQEGESLQAGKIVSKFFESATKLMETIPEARLELLAEPTLTTLLFNKAKGHHDHVGGFVDQSFVKFCSQLCSLTLCENEDKAAVHFQEFKMDTLVELLVNWMFFDDVAIWRTVIRGLKNVYDYAPSAINNYLEQGLARRLLEILNTQTLEDTARVTLLKWLGNIIYDGKCTLLLINCSLVPCLQTQMKHPNAEVRKAVFYVLSNLAGETSHLDDIVREMVSLRLGRALWLEILPAEKDHEVQAELGFVMYHLSIINHLDQKLREQVVVDDYLIHGIIRCMKPDMPESTILQAYKAFEHIWPMFRYTEKFKRLHSLFKLVISHPPPLRASKTHQRLVKLLLD